MIRRITAKSVAPILTAGLMVCLTAGRGMAAPVLSLKALDGTASAQQTAGVGTLKLDLYLDTAGSPVDALQYFLNAPSVKYAAPVATALIADGSFFGAADLFASPAAGTAVARGASDEGLSIWFTFGTDFTSFNGKFVEYTFDTSALPASATPYVFTPVFDTYLAASGVATTTFDPPGTFSLLVTAAPEPAVLSWSALSVLVATRRFRRTAPPRL